ncbi:outer membrane lipoprotein-sorting protein [Labilibacter marinus]|uniref:outer membrane lipoprotein-sorting protein n=1 Tax=Labilibacter marinus TaxID=1477105 RepID=UPI00094F81F3|nr:outer membrane lipoprotein-sorting protein [Labilibacter marinus]
MLTRKTILNLVFVSMLSLITLNIGAQTAAEIVQKANDKRLGEKSSISEMSMIIKRPTYERSLSFKSWTKGTKYSITLVTGPAREKGQAFLKRDREMWNWNPKISRMIKLPPSMMSQGWMGSDYTNDDAMNQASIVKDYTHKMLGEETVENLECYKIESIPFEEASVAWGKVILWISKEESLLLKQEYYDEDDFLIKTELGHNIKTLSGRVLPTQFEIIPADKPDQRTIVNIESIEFNPDIEDNFFSQQNIKKIR